MPRLPGFLLQAEPNECPISSPLRIELDFSLSKPISAAYWSVAVRRWTTKFVYATLCLRRADFLDHNAVLCLKRLTMLRST
jgi:hypothetical protein